MMEGEVRRIANDLCTAKQPTISSSSLFMHDRVGREAQVTRDYEVNRKWKVPLGSEELLIGT